MIPYSQFPRPVGSFPTPLIPPGVDPDKGNQIFVQFAQEWLPYVLGALQQLLLQSTWVYADKSELLAIQEQAFHILSIFGMSIDNQTSKLICLPNVTECEDEMSLCDNVRINNGKLQVLCCGAWVDVSGQGSQGIGGSGQPGLGSPLPVPNGGCEVYHASMIGSDQWLAPPVVNAGDTVQISNVQGAWSDGTGLWFTPTGNTFFAGLAGPVVLDPTDPIPTAPHMALLSKIAGVFTDVSNGVIFTVPGGVTNALLIFQANDPTIADNGGQITFDVTVCNNAVSRFTHHFDFRLGTYGFQLDPLAGNTGSLWTPGAGYSASIVGAVHADSGAANIYLNNTHLLHNVVMRLVGSCTSGVNGAALEQITAPWPPEHAGEYYIDHTSGAIDFTHAMIADILGFSFQVTSGNAVGQSCTLTDGWITADGVDPF